MYEKRKRKVLIRFIREGFLGKEELESVLQPASDIPRTGTRAALCALTCYVFTAGKYLGTPNISFLFS